MKYLTSINFWFLNDSKISYDTFLKQNIDRYIVYHPPLRFDKSNCQNSWNNFTA